MENPSASSSSSRAEAFPAGLRVLVVDDDPTWLKILEKMLRKCSYEVTTCGLARVALDMLRERRDRFDIVISDVNMPDMDGFKLLEHVGLEMDLPVIMMSVDGETSRVMKGVQHGACDYLLKPVRMKELRNIWQHVFRKKIHEIKEVESHDGSEEFQFLRNRFEEFEERQMLYGGDLNYTKKRKDVENKDHFDPDFIDPVSVKKARVVWTVDLHQKFVNAVNQIGFDKVGPKKILDLMNVPGLTRENVASHLQKYRLYLSRLQKQNDGITFGGAMPSDLGSKDPTGNFCLQSSKAVARNVSTDGFAFSAKRNHAQGMKQEVSSDELKSVVVQTEDSRKALASCSTESQKAKTVSQLGVVLPPKGLIPNAEYKPYESTIPNHHCWSGGIPAIPFTQYSRQDQESFSLATNYQSLQRTVKEQVGDDHLSSTPSARTIIATRAWNESGSFQIKPVSSDYRSNDSSSVHINSVPVQVDRGVLDSKHIDVGLRNSGSLNMKGQYADQYLFGSLDSPQKNNLTNGSTLSSSPEDLVCSLDGYGCFENVGLNGTEVLNHDNSCQMTELQGNLYDGLQLDCEYVFELMKYPTIGGGLFT